MKPVKALFLSTAAMTISFVVWSVFSPIAGQIQQTFGLTVVQKSVLLAAPVLLGSVLRIAMGILTDRYDRRVRAAGYADSPGRRLFGRPVRQPEGADARYSRHIGRRVYAVVLA